MILKVNNMIIKLVYEVWGLSHGNYLFFFRKTDRSLDLEETWKYANGSG